MATRNVKQNAPKPVKVAQILPPPAAPVITAQSSAIDIAALFTPKNAVAQKLAAEAKTANGSKAVLKEVAQSKKDIYFVNPFELTIREGWNLRIWEDPRNEERVDKMAHDIIAAKGIIKPLIVFYDDGKLIVEDGETRLRGLFRAIEVYGYGSLPGQVITVPVTTRERGTPEDERRFSQITLNGSDSRPSPLEYAHRFYEMTTLYGWSVEKIAQGAAMSVQRVNQLLDLNAASKEIKDLLIAGTVTANFVIQTLHDNNNDSTAALRVLTAAKRQAEAQGKTRATRKHVEGALKPIKRTVVAAALNRSLIDRRDAATVKIEMSVDDFSLLEAFFAAKQKPGAVEMEAAEEPEAMAA